MQDARWTIGGCGGGLSRSGGPSTGRPAAWIVLLMVFASFVASRPAVAQQANEAPAPELLLMGSEYSEVAPLLEIDFALSVTGVVARGTVIQRFRNPTEQWLEGVYRFPLPEGAAVDGLRMKIGERVIEGEIREREEARQTFERARDAGQRASLVEQQRPDVFTSRVANVGPGVEIAIEIDLQWTLELDAGGFSLRLPWIVGPRFMPGDPGEGARAITTPPTAGAARPDVAFAIELDTGFPLVSLESPTHEIALEQLDLHRFIVTLARDVAPADRDFVLRWRPTPDTLPRVALFHEAHEDEEGEDYLLLMLLPPDVATAAAPPEREIVFVIDTSGSMGGASIEQARRALMLALERLGPQDRFNVVAFDSDTRTLFPGPVFADRGAIAKATAWVASLEAGGGTEMLPALVEALRDDTGGPGLRQVVFVTDGCVGNEQQLFTYVQTHLGRSRLFTVGIGSAPNGHFMEGAARFGRGSRTFIASPNEVGERMEALFAKLERPALTDVEIHWNDAIEVWPARLPDLYGGEPLLVTAKVERFVGNVTVRGQLGDETFETHLPLEPGRPKLGVEKLFGRRKIAALLDGLTRGEDEASVREDVIAVALDHGLVSRWTSLVAVERTPVRPASQSLASGEVPAGMPAGFLLPAGGTSGPMLRLLAVGSTLLSMMFFLASGRRRA